MQLRFRHLTPLAFVLLASCSENDLGVGVVDAAADSPASTGGVDSPSTGGSGGATVGSGGGGGGTVGSGGAGGAAGACGQATCLASLFATCVPAGACAVHAGNSPSAVFSDTCYENGVTVNTLGTYSGTNTIARLSVARNGVGCYSVETSTSADGVVAYTVNDGIGRVYATGITADKAAGTVTMTCTSGTPTTVTTACLQPVSSNVTCELAVCPSTGGGDAGDEVSPAPTPDAPPSSYDGPAATDLAPPDAPTSSDALDAASPTYCQASDGRKIPIGAAFASGFHCCLCLPNGGTPCPAPGIPDSAYATYPPSCHADEDCSPGRCLFAPGCASPTGSCVVPPADCPFELFPVKFQYCGCDGVTFELNSTSQYPYRPYAHVGACP